MRSHTRALLAVPTIAALALAGAQPALARPADLPRVEAASATDSTTFDFDAEPGAHPVDGRSGHWTSAAATDDLEVDGGLNTVKLWASTDNGRDTIDVQLSAAPGATLTRRVYRKVRGAEQHLNGPSILVISNGIGCADDYAQFTISRIKRDKKNVVTALDASFEQRCGSPTGPALRGSIHYTK